LDHHQNPWVCAQTSAQSQPNRGSQSDSQLLLNILKIRVRNIETSR
jgi:hypothetical protein